MKRIWNFIKVVFVILLITAGMIAATYVHWKIWTAIHPGAPWWGYFFH